MLASLGTAKQFMNLPQDDFSQDDNLVLALLASSQAIENYCNRTFNKQSYTDILSAAGNYLSIKNFPVVRVNSVVSVNGDEITDYILLPDGILYRQNGWNIRDYNYTVTYEAGYVLPDEATTEQPQTLPKPLELACIFLAQMIFKGQIGLKEKRIADITYKYADVSDNQLPSTVVSLIQPYKVWWR
ncbi:phage gp6-like head-tail connector protein [Paenibacillus spongiae]|uniref:Phage gp6-like head-tail connector protein n=1 Tax=Paenibacillus spongiae TaxID=2909671 RepID=A0ABY5SEL5_9BACL|nr:phage gp6-like head-tail connector protein [Paenibacillus spongiae]UVI32084.1 phage gp6-like head-tail connector protein [Paenibacillus spongiae]